MFDYENTTNYKTILIPSLMIYNDGYYDLEDVQDGHSKWRNIYTNKSILASRNFKGDEYVMFSEAYLLGREVEFFRKDERHSGFIKSAHVVIDEERTDDEYNPTFKIMITLDTDETVSIYSLSFLTEVDEYTKSGQQVLVEIFKSLNVKMVDNCAVDR